MGWLEEVAHDVEVFVGEDFFQPGEVHVVAVVGLFCLRVVEEFARLVGRCLMFVHGFNISNFSFFSFFYTHTRNENRCLILIVVTGVAVKSQTAQGASGRIYIVVYLFAVIHGFESFFNRSTWCLMFVHGDSVVSFCLFYPHVHKRRHARPSLLPFKAFQMLVEGLLEGDVGDVDFVHAVG